jgi:predicted nucleic acid-binding protein
MYLLDTCALSETTKIHPQQSVIDWFALQPNDALYVSAITVGELQRGVERMSASRRKSAIEKWIREEFLSRFHGRVVGIDTDTALYWGSFRATLESRGRKRPVLDGMIAATALVHDLTLVTRNVGDFKGTGVKLFDPWSGI